MTYDAIVDGMIVSGLVCCGVLGLATIVVLVIEATFGEA